MQEKVAAEMFMLSSQRKYFKSFHESRKIIDKVFLQYLCIGYLNSKISETALKDLCDPY